MADVVGSVKVCETEGCSKDARLQCPTCIKLGIPGSYFCSQDCFKSSWDTHKKLHKQAKENAQQKNGPTESYNPWPGYAFTGKLRPLPVGPARTVPEHIPRPDYADHPEGYPASERAIRGSTNIETLSDEDQELLRIACKLGREVLDEAAKAVAVGVTTDEIDRIVHEACIERECYPSPLNYYNFPKSCCTSINEVICHGIPDQRPLRDGEIVNIDVTTYYRGFHGDLNETLFVGQVDDKAKLLVQTTHECLAKAIAAVRPGVRYREIGDIIQKHAQSNGFSVVRSYCGHGIHRLFHTAPSVPHYAKNKAVGVMKPGHSFTIEPMINEGTWRDQTWPDNWTSVTQDGRLSAQFEHTLLVTETGCDVLTKRIDRDGQPHFMDSL
jgi:methionyl aminopeptidase